MAATTRTISSFVATAVAVLLAGACDENDTTEPEIDDVAQSWYFTDARGLNEAGVVVGRAQRMWLPTPGDTVWQTRAAMWTQQGGLEVLPLPAGFDEAYAKDVNDAGQILVTAVDTPSYTYSAHLWHDDTWTALGDFHPVALGEDGTVVGYRVEDYRHIPVRLAPGGALEDLDAMLGIGACGAARQAAPRDVAGDIVVGNTLDNGVAMHSEAVAVIGSEASLLFTECGFPPQSTAEGVNASGWIVGWNGATTTAYLRKPGEEPQSLGALPGHTDSWGVSCAFEVSDDGWIAGSSHGPEGTHAVRWTPAGQIQDLGRGTALEINDAGMAVGAQTYAPVGPVVVWLTDGTRIELAGPNGTPGTDDWRPLGSHRAQLSRQAAMSIPCAGGH